MWCFQRPLRWRLPDFLFELSIVQDHYGMYVGGVRCQ